MIIEFPVTFKSKLSLGADVFPGHVIVPGAFYLDPLDDFLYFSKLVSRRFYRLFGDDTEQLNPSNSFFGGLVAICGGGVPSRTISRLRIFSF